MGNSIEGGKTISAQIQIFDDYEKIEKPGCKPKGSIKLDNAKIESSYSSPAASNTSSPAYTSTMVLASQGAVNISSSPSLSMGSSSTSQTGSTPSLSAGSASGSIPGPNGNTDIYIFTVATSSGDLHEFRTDSENDRLRWVKLLQLLVMYPYSPIPEEPKVNPIKDSFRQALEAKQYNAGKLFLLNFSVNLSQLFKLSLCFTHCPISSPFFPLYTSEIRGEGKVKGCLHTRMFPYVEKTKDVYFQRTKKSFHFHMGNWFLLSVLLCHPGWTSLLAKVDHGWN